MLAIFLYKVTFEETDDFYWGIHLQRKKNDGYMGSPVTHAWKWDFYTPKLDILHYFEPTEEGWEEAQRVEKRVITPDLNNPKCLNENVGGALSLEPLKRGGIKGAETAFVNVPKEVRSERAKKARKVRGKKKTEQGKELHSFTTITKQHSIKNPEGKSALAVSGAEAFHSQRDEQGRSVRMLERHSDKDEFGSKLARKSNESRMRPVEVLDISCGVAFVFPCVNDAARAFGLSPGNLRATAKQEGEKGYRPQTKGFKARFI